MKAYTISFDKVAYTSKPSGREVGTISNRLITKSIQYDILAHLCGEAGCSFSPAVFNGKRRRETYIEQQLIVLDFDSGIKFEVIKERAERYRLPILFAYKSFSWSEALSKFRVVFSLADAVEGALTGETVTAMFMQIFRECDSTCSDCSRMFFGGKGLLYLAEKPNEITLQDLQLAFRCSLCDTYDEKHYMAKVRQFYEKCGVKTERNVPLLENGQFVCTEKIPHEKKCRTREKSGTNRRRKQTRNFSWDALYECCQLFRQFADGTEYYYYPELFLLATNLINIEKGKAEFLRILNLPENAGHAAYHERNWRVILNLLRDEGYQPQSCADCPYASVCNHRKNLILTAKQGRSCIRTITEKEYCTLQEAEQSLAENFQAAMASQKNGIHLIIAQTGLGKTNTYLNYLKSADKRVLIAVPTHALKWEIVQKAQRMGITNIRCTPELPTLSDEITSQLKHNYNIGAGSVNLSVLREILSNMEPEHQDHAVLKTYLEELADVVNYEGHIVTTHERLLYFVKDEKPLCNHEVIIDEDILRTVFATETVSNEDIRQAMQCTDFKDTSKHRMQEILTTNGFRQYNVQETENTSLSKELLGQLEQISTNIIDMLSARYLCNHGESTTYIRQKPFYFQKVIVMSATANAQVYRMLLPKPVFEYRCKTAKYRGRLKLYPQYTFSRYSLYHDPEIKSYIDSLIGDSTVITFKAFEELFGTAYHFGAVEGLNCLEGKDIAVIGLPNVNDIVYKLYGMAAGVDPQSEELCPMKVQYHGYEFYANSYRNDRLRTIQLWMLESLLEQAVGRARLLRFDCEVKVFARFPIDQATVM